MTTSAEMLFNRIREKVEVLCRERGDKSQSAVLLGEFDDLASKIKKTSLVKLPTINSAHAVGATPTAAEHNALVDDIASIIKYLAEVRKAAGG